MIRLAVFDMQGTTIRDGNAVQQSFTEATAHAGIHVKPERLYHVMGLPKPEAIRILLTESGQRFTEADVVTIHADFVQRMIAYYSTQSGVEEIPGASQVFRTLREAGLKVALNTGFSRSIVDVLLRRLGWDATVFDGTITSDEVTRGRPFPDMIQALMQRFGISHGHDVAKIGDTQADLEEGTNSGCGVVIGVTTGAYTREQLLPYPHTHIVGSVVEVPALLLP